MYRAGNALVISNKKEDIIHIMEQVLSSLGVNLKQVENDPEMLDTINFDLSLRLVIIDFDNTEHSLKLCEKIRNKKEKFELPIILVSNNITREQRIEALSKGVDDIYYLPLDDKELWYRLNNLLELRTSNLELETVNNSLTQILSYSEEMFDKYDLMWFELETVEKELIDKVFFSEYSISAPEVVYIFLRENDYVRCRKYLFQMSRYILVDNYILASNEGPVMCNVLRRGTGTTSCLMELDREENSSYFSLKCETCNIYRYILDLNDVVNYITSSYEDVSVVAVNFMAEIGFLQKEILRGLVNQITVYKRMNEQTKELRSAFTYTAGALSRAAEAVDFETGNHIKRISKYSLLLARQFGFSGKGLDELSYSSKMHDVGKIKIGPDILLKEGPLTKEEFMEMQNHTIYGVLILGDSPYFAMAREIAMYHHERYDGTGYPYGLQGEEIPFTARLVAICDVYDALRSKRPYKPSFSHEKAYKIITEGDGRVEPEHFCPRVLESFKALEKEFERIYEQEAD
ncbi:HD domain-containing phosphohydrolase [Natranaerofaba carboxydovora]|uniref:response regulator n=1 Tax=Natranaerofaba carboxydovora TaxID=2742683 RepID=UPI001F12E99D|nr:HD domain-containing phosphohydrolase [Natranaerofaba carboxydovora]UMZ74487.1 3'3'-cGAMP-specific phosphodiesterase 2 [Natranaerofaba carboxydovora]